MSSTLVFIIFFASSPPNPTGVPEKANNQKPPSAQYNNSSPSFIPTANSEGDKGEAENKTPSEPKSYFLRLCDRFEVPINLFSAVAVAFFTAILTIYTIKMWKTSKQELRAYVGITSTGIRLIQGLSRISARVEIKNSGQTIAYRAACGMCMIIKSGPSSDSEDLEQETGAIPLPPGGTYWLERFRDLSEAEQRDVRNGIASIYVVGRIDYTDAFNKRQFCCFRLHYNSRTVASNDKCLMLAPIGDPKDNDAS